MHPRAGMQGHSFLSPNVMSAHGLVCGCARPRCLGSREEGQGSNLLEGPCQCGRPGPALGETQHDGSAAVDEATREGEDAGVHARATVS